MPTNSQANTASAPEGSGTPAVNGAPSGSGAPSGNGAPAAGDAPAVPKPGCCGDHGPTACIGGLWTSREMTDMEDREIVVRTNLRELIVYLVFLAVVSILAVSTTSPTMFYFTKALSELFWTPLLPTPMGISRNRLKYWIFGE
ncbi:polycystic kidney disease 2-like 1 protein [Amphibalanus amphitrite]|uniref:polycystic kidney disease 2-like 1 protein n=1 Tax=Amphibalanus amphitrite TaxID=1232801 RepID=UPI001C922750|nr:polycystic kidney disease 2-like 1 protein [Amphibalanus amphitrite]